MSDDLVKRLRDASAIPTGLYSEAADEIEKLQAQYQSAVNVLSAYGIVEVSKGCFSAMPDAQAKEIERLRKQRDELVEELKDAANALDKAEAYLPAQFAYTALAKIEGGGK